MPQQSLKPNLLVMNRIMNAIRYGSINSVNSGLGRMQSLYEEHRWTIEQFAIHGV